MSSEIETSAIDWQSIAASLDEKGYALTDPVLSAADCERVQSFYDDPDTVFRSTINMARYNFGSGEYKYFGYPLPDIVQSLRESFYSGLAPVADAWEQRFGNEARWPATLDALTRICNAEGQHRPTPLMLRYGKGDYNCLHQDLYGEIHFPLQVVVMLSDPEKDFEGGELVLVEQRPRMQSRPIVIQPRQGAAVIIPVRDRPRKGTRGYHRAPMRHGVGEITAGKRHTLGVIFHDAA